MKKVLIIAVLGLFTLVLPTRADTITREFMVSSVICDTNSDKEVTSDEVKLLSKGSKITISLETMGSKKNSINVTYLFRFGDNVKEVKRHYDEVVYWEKTDRFCFMDKNLEPIIIYDNIESLLIIKENLIDK